MAEKLREIMQANLQSIQDKGLYKQERPLLSQQGPTILSQGSKLINLCSNNYLGLCNHPEILKSAQTSLAYWGYGLASVRFICGTQEIHQALEKDLSEFLGFEDAILYSSCFDANGGLFETLLEPEDAVISDALNHASIIDGIRLCKAQKYRYSNSNMEQLEDILKQTQGSRLRLIATDGVFSMDGYIAKLQDITDLAAKYHALVMVDDSHAVGFMGANGKGTHEYCGVLDKIDILTGTLGKALGGASGGYTVGKREVVAWLRQRSRPYLFSNSLAPMIASTSRTVLKLITQEQGLRAKLLSNAAMFRSGLQELGFEVLSGQHPIIPIMTYDSKLAQELAQGLMHHGVYVTGFSYPVVPKNEARIRTQVSAVHSNQDLKLALDAFRIVGKKLGLIG